MQKAIIMHFTCFRAWVPWGARGSCRRVRLRSRCPLRRRRASAGGNCMKIGLPGKLILGDYFQENMNSPRPFLLLRVSFPGRPIFIQFVPDPVLAREQPVRQQVGHRVHPRRRRVGVHALIEKKQK